MIIVEEKEERECCRRRERTHCGKEKISKTLIP